MANQNNGPSVSEQYAALQLEEMQFNVDKMRSTKQTRQKRRASIERSLKAQMQRETTIQARCWHKKGGKGVEMMYQGSDALYAVIKNILPTGTMQVFCQRCGRMWAPPPAELNRRGASIEDKRLYARLYKEYQDAVNYPTDNETSGSQLFLITHGNPEALEATA
jgi:hypothetical protein